MLPGEHQAYIHREIFRSWLRQRTVSRLRARQDYKVATFGIIFWNFRLHQIRHVILSRYILGDRGIGGRVRENNANRFLLRING